MLDGGGGGGTSWESMSIEQMRMLIQNPDLDKHWELLTGWQRSADLINEHRSQIENYKANLAAAWPPDKSEASFKYLEQLDILIANLSETYEAAIANHKAFSSATLSISLAQQDVEDIYWEYSSNAQLLASFTASQQQSSSTPTPTPSPSGEEPPVAPGRQEELRQKAAARLAAVSTDLAQAQVNIVTPTPYKPGAVKDTETDLTNGGYVPPFVPPITPIPGGDSGSAASPSSRASAPFPVGSNTQPGAISPGAQQPSLGNQQPGLVLGGATTPVTNPPVNTIAPTQPGLPGGSSGPITNPGIPPVSPFLPNGGGGTISNPPANGVGRGPGLPREGIMRTGTPGPGGLHAMPPGGLIGGAPGVGMRQPGAARPGARRINPVGGVIGEQATPGGTTGRGMAGQHASGGMGTTYGQTGGSRRGRDDQSDENHWDPDNPWQTAEGVDPVVLPSREQRIDPGPAIGLS